MSNHVIEFPFQHPAAAEVARLFRALDVASESAYRALPPRDRYLYDVVWFENDVMNGGVDQYFNNSGGDHAAECLVALDAIGAMASSDLLRQACQLYPDGKPSADQLTRCEQLLKLVGERCTVDDLISGYIEPDLYQRLLDYYHSV